MSGSHATTPHSDALMTRLQELVDRFDDIGRASLSDLPIYNDSLMVEALGFVPHDEGWLGVLITPWFMNLIILPAERTDFDLMSLGRLVDKDIPSGTWPFSLAGDDVIGGYFSKPLHSPMDNFKSQDMARATAEAAILDALVAPKPEIDGGAQEADAVPSCEEKVNLGRRNLYRGPYGKALA